ncbi:AAA family ATPase [Streptomyces sp. NPDC014889]|uniref:helix-turn-helix transcriptional regulator n=1 Tax=Streptomyces sp. NPDC014889 TaxID=3364928 RepID=UPI0036FBC07E
MQLLENLRGRIPTKDFLSGEFVFPWTKIRQPSVLHGREQEVVLLKRILDETSSHLRAIDISGDPWIGKTRLLSVLGDLAHAQGWTVGSGAARSLSEALPFGVFSDALYDVLARHRGNPVDGLPEQHISWLAGICPALAPYAREALLPKDPMEMNHAFHAVRALLDNLGAAGRLLLVIDDMHWADEASVRLFMHLLRHSTGSPVLLAIARRPRQIHAELRTLLEEGAATGQIARIHLSPLADEDLAALLPAGLSPSRRRTLQEESGGNPGLIQALAAQQGTAGAPGGDAALSGTGTPVSVIREFRGLSELGWAAAHSAALVGESIDIGLLEAVAQLPEDRVRAGVDELVRHDILRVDESERTFMFRNALLRETAYQAAGAAWRLGAHTRAAAVMRTRNAPPPQVARHLQRCIVAGDPESMRLLLEAARTVLWEQPETAALWSQTVLELQRHDKNADRTEHLLLFATSLALCGKLTESLALFRRASDTGRDGDAEAVLSYAQVLRLLGRISESGDLLRKALRTMAPAQRTQARLHGALLATSLEAGCMADLPNDALLEPIAAVDDPALRTLLLSLNALADLNQNAPGRAEDRVNEARTLVDHLPNNLLAPQLDSLYWLGLAEHRLGEYERAVQHLERALHLASRYGQTHLVPQVATVLGSVLLRLGDLAGAALHAEHAQEAARHIGSEVQLTSATRLMEEISRPPPLQPAPVQATADAADPDHLTAGATAAGQISGMGPGSASKLEETGRRTAPPSEANTHLDLLSKREREISGLVSDGRTNQQIARALGLSHKTVETYLARIFKKLDLCSRAQLATLVGRADGTGPAFS